MATVNDKYIIELERERKDLVDTLINKGVSVEKDAPLNELIPKIKELQNKDALNEFINNEITEYRNDKITNIGGYKFVGQTNLKKVYLPNVVSISTSTFSGNTNLKYIYMPNLLIIGQSSFSTNTNLKNCIFPKLNTMGDVVFQNCSGAMKNLIIPNVGAVPSSTFSNMAFELIDCSARNAFGSTTIGRYTKTLILRSTIPPCSNITHFSSIEEIYISQDYVEDMKKATNWSTYADKIKPLEGSKYENLNWYENEDWYKEEMAVWQ